MRNETDLGRRQGLAPFPIRGNETEDTRSIKVDLPDFRNFEAGRKHGVYTLDDMHKEENEMMLRGGSALPLPVPPLTTLADLGPSASEFPNA